MGPCSGNRYLSPDLRSSGVLLPWTLGRARASSALIKSEPRLSSFVRRDFPCANRHPPPDQVRGRASLENASAIRSLRGGVFGGGRGSLTFPRGNEFALDLGPLGRVHRGLFAIWGQFIHRQVR